jgi:Transcriptional regulator
MNSLTRQNLIDAFWQLYCKKTIEKITVKEVCETAGYNRSTFYVYFKDVYDILEYIEQETITVDEFFEHVYKYMFFEVDKKKALRSILQVYDNNEKYLPVLLGENGDIHFRKNLINKIKPVVLSNFFQHLNEKELNQLNYIIEYQTAGVLNLISKWYSNQKDIPIEDMVDILFSVTTNGVLTEMDKYRNRRSE